MLKSEAIPTCSRSTCSLRKKHWEHVGYTLIGVYPHAPVPEKWERLGTGGNVWTERNIAIARRSPPDDAGCGCSP